jgi:hypothetical protein
MASYFPTDNFFLNVSRGLVKGASFTHEFGYNPSVDTNTDPETVWSYGGLYPWTALNSPQVLYVKSSDDTDTGTILLTGLDADYNPITATIVLTGTTAVSTGAIAFKRIHRMRVVSGSHVGQITAHTVNGNGTVVSHISVGEGQATTAIYTIPAGKIGYLYKGDASTNQDAVIKFYVRPSNNGFQVAHIAEVVTGQYIYDFPFPSPLPEKTDLEVRCDFVNNNNTRVAINFDILLLDNPII